MVINLVSFASIFFCKLTPLTITQLHKNTYLQTEDAFFVVLSVAFGIVAGYYLQTSIR